jgi:asparagine synthase (glutamine-hydrolysing)
MKVRDGQGKWILRQWLARHFPASEPFRKKQGFTVPVGAWIAEEADRLAPLVAAQAGVAAVAKPDRILPLFRAAAGKREGFAAWHLLFHALWHRRHVEGRRAEGDVHAFLGQG